MEPVMVPNETSESSRWNRCSPDCSNQDYKKVLRKTSVPVTGFMEVLGWTRTSLPSGYVICLHLKIKSNAIRRPRIARTGVHRITCWGKIEHVSIKNRVWPSSGDRIHFLISLKSQFQFPFKVEWFYIFHRSGDRAEQDLITLVYPVTYCVFCTYILILLSLYLIYFNRLTVLLFHSATVCPRRSFGRGDTFCEEPSKCVGSSGSFVGVQLSFSWYWEVLLGFLRLCKEDVEPEGAAEVQEALSLGPSEVLAEIF